jgi:hypothetical protein
LGGAVGFEVRRGQQLLHRQASVATQGSRWLLPRCRVQAVPTFYHQTISAPETGSEMGRRQTLAAKMDTVPIGTDGDQSEGRVNRATGARERRDKRRRCWMGEARVLKKPATAANNNATQINVERRDNHQRRSGKGLKEKRAGQKGGRNLRSAAFLQRTEVTMYLSTDNPHGCNPGGSPKEGPPIPCNPRGGTIVSPDTLPPSTVCLTPRRSPGAILTAFRFAKLSCAGVKVGFSAGKSGIVSEIRIAFVADGAAYMQRNLSPSSIPGS